MVPRLATGTVTEVLQLIQARTGHKECRPHGPESEGVREVAPGDQRIGFELRRGDSFVEPKLHLEVFCAIGFPKRLTGFVL